MYMFTVKRPDKDKKKQQQQKTKKTTTVSQQSKSSVLHRKCGREEKVNLLELSGLLCQFCVLPILQIKII